MPAYWIVRGAEEIDERLQYLKQHLVDKNVWPIRMDIKRHVDQRTLPQNALFWMWCDQLVDHFAKGGQVYQKQAVHDLLCHKFLGYQEVEVEGVMITRLRGTSKLDKGEFQHFMEQVDEYAVSLGCKLTYPKASEYAQYKEAQVA